LGPVLGSPAGFCSNRQVSESFAGCGSPRAPENCERCTVQDPAGSCDKLPAKEHYIDSRALSRIRLIVSRKNGKLLENKN